MPDPHAPNINERAGVLARARTRKMASSAHAYMRGNTVKFYTWLNDFDAQLPQGPSIWICGDCHLGNLGPLADSRGKVALQIRDLDQSVIGNPAHDMIRLGLSLACAARGSDLPGVTTALMLEALVAGYVSALGGDFEDSDAPSERPKAVKSTLTNAIHRRWHHLAVERLENREPSIPLGKRFWPLSDSERVQLDDLFSTAQLHQMVTGPSGRDDGDKIELIDAAYWMKGCSSLGRARYAALLQVGAAELCLIDVKAAVTAAAPHARGAKMPHDNAQRVVAGAKALSPNLGERMLAARLGGQGVVLRELTPQDLKLDIDQLTGKQAVSLADYLARVVGRAHGRQMSPETRADWIKVLAAGHTSSLDAPSWLWSSVVDLAALHEAAYLNHCRAYALDAAI